MTCTEKYINKGFSKKQAEKICKDKGISPFVFALNSYLIMKLYKGEFSTENLPQFLFDYHVLNLQANLYVGYGLPSQYKKDALDFVRLTKAKKNINVFSGSKTFKQVELLTRALYDNKGNKIAFKKFKDIANVINTEYNKNYLKTEKDTVFAVSQAMEDWRNVEKTADTFPLLKYVTVGDERVRSEHRLWNGIVKPVNDKFWDTHYPPSDWNCRCTVEQLEDVRITDLDEHLNKFNKQNKTDFKTLNNTSKVFNQNAGKTGVIFGKKHSYFDVPKKYKDAQQLNFNFIGPTDKEIINFTNKQLKK